jgi:hypothetical protein
MKIAGTPNTRLRCFHSDSLRVPRARGAASRCPWRAAEARDHHGENHQHDRDQAIGQDHRLGIGQPLRRGQHHVGAGGAALRPAQDQVGAEHRRQHRSRRIHRLHQIEARGGGFGLADHGHIRVGRHLQQGDAAGDHEQHGQRHPVGRDRGGQHHAERARRHDQQADHQRLLVARLLDQLGRGDRGHEIGDEPHRFDQCCLRIVEIEHAAQMRQQRVVDHRDEAPHEEQAGQQRQRRAVADGEPALSGEMLLFSGTFDCVEATGGMVSASSRLLCAGNGSYRLAQSVFVRLYP